MFHGSSVYKSVKLNLCMSINHSHTDLLHPRRTANWDLARTCEQYSWGLPFCCRLPSLIPSSVLCIQRTYCNLGLALFGPGFRALREVDATISKSFQSKNYGNAKLDRLVREHRDRAGESRAQEQVNLIMPRAFWKKTGVLLRERAENASSETPGTNCFGPCPSNVCSPRSLRAGAELPSI